MNKLLSEHKNICEMYKTISTEKIAKIYNVSRGTISKILKDNGVVVGKYITYKNKILDTISEEDKKNIVSMYKNRKKISDISRILNIKKHWIRLILKTLGVTIRPSSQESRKYFLVEDYFKKIDTNHKAYFLGLLYADGCIHSSRTSISISLSKCDDYILKKFAKLIYKNKYKFHIAKLSEKNKKHSDSVRLVISSKKIQDDLNVLGVVPRKSLVLQFPTKNQVPREYMWHFIRGYFDGDGSVSVIGKTSRKAVVNFVGSHDFIHGLSEFFIEENIKCSVYRYGQQSTSQLKIHGRVNLLSFYEKCYNECQDIFLRRKKKKFNKWDSTERPKYSKHIGITFDKSRNKWVANKSGKCIDRYESEQEAILKLNEYNKN